MAGAALVTRSWVTLAGRGSKWPAMHAGPPEPIIDCNAQRHDLRRSRSRRCRRSNLSCMSLPRLNLSGRLVSPAPGARLPHTSSPGLLGVDSSIAPCPPSPRWHAGQARALHPTVGIGRGYNPITSALTGLPRSRPNKDEEYMASSYCGVQLTDGGVG